MTVFQSKLLAWYQLHKRDLPWRKTKDPYKIWVSEVMLQQTQVKTVIPYYQRFVRQFPTIASLASISLDHVLKAWEGLGYYARARNLHRAAQEICRRFRGRLPATYSEIILLPGIGEYMAAAILSIAYGEPYSVLDGNVKRVLSRLFAIRKNVSLPAVSKQLFGIATSLLPSVPPSDPGIFNQAMMELGATICLPRNPQCGPCPVASFCLAKAKGIQELLPLKGRPKRLPIRQNIALWITRGDRLLLGQRQSKGLLGGLFDLPDGSIPVRRGERLAGVTHTYTHFQEKILVYQAFLLDGVPPGYRFIRFAELSQYALPKRVHKVLAALTHSKVDGWAGPTLLGKIIVK